MAEKGSVTQEGPGGGEGEERGKEGEGDSIDGTEVVPQPQTPSTAYECYVSLKLVGR